MSRRTSSCRVLVPLCIVALLASCNGSGNADAGRTSRAEQAQSFRTVAMQDDWANYEVFFDGFCRAYDLGCSGSGQGPNRFDSDMTATQMFAQFTSGTSDPYVCGDIGMHNATLAGEVALRYTPRGADALPPEYKQEGGGWIAEYLGAISFWVNTDVVSEPPQTWTALLSPEYEGMISMSDPRESGTGAATVYAAAAALGGGQFDFDAAFAFFRQLQASGNLSPAQFSNASMERGEIPIAIRYDFVGVIGAAELAERGVHTEVIIPKDGSVWAPSAIVCNANTDKPELAKAIMDYSLTDEAQLAFAQYGARPIRYVVGDLEVPASASERWLPEDAYARTVEITSWMAPDQMTARWESEVLG
jgi:putative spermidine/putrescine transport system substrate-binding protein